MANDIGALSSFTSRFSQGMSKTRLSLCFWSTPLPMTDSSCRASNCLLTYDEDVSVSKYSHFSLVLPVFCCVHWTRVTI